MTATTTSTTNGHDAGVVQRRSDECNIRLIAWDPTNEEHFERMVQQRLSCGWDSDAVGVWKKKLLDGNKFMYWVVSSTAVNLVYRWYERANLRWIDPQGRVCRATDTA